MAPKAKAGCPRQSCDEFVHKLLDEHAGVDFPIDNAGRSIRRAIEAGHESVDDFEHTMRFNYFGSLPVTLGPLAGMVGKRSGHIVSISSISALVNAPHFSAWVASKAAPDAWSRWASSEFADKGVALASVHMSLLRTPMTTPTKIHDNVPLLEPEQASNMIVQACIDKPCSAWTTGAWRSSSPS